MSNNLASVECYHFKGLLFCIVGNLVTENFMNYCNTLHTNKYVHLYKECVHLVMYVLFYAC